MYRILLAFLFLPFFAWSQSNSPAPKPEQKGWHLLDPKKDGYTGISLDEAYALLKGRTATTVTVAVIDSGIDTTQEDLQGVLWTNPHEIPANGIDDDHNGYIDDVHGWNFDGAPNGENLVRNSHEVERTYHTWKKDFEGKKASDIPAGQRFLFGQWQKAAALIDKNYKDAKNEIGSITEFLSGLTESSKVLEQQLSSASFIAAQIRPLANKLDPTTVSRAAQYWLDIFSRGGDTSVSSATIIQQVENYKNTLDKNISLKETPPENWRGQLIKDNYLDINDRFYGNNNLKTGSGNHGTGVAGTIGAIRGNGIGIDGIADHVRIMAVRAMPGGDEYDKDVALAIRYAVDNGAQIINMSLGKPVSPQKQFVDDAVRYAASKGVLIVHACGNDGQDITTDQFYPSPQFIDGTMATNFLNVGASGDPSTGGYAASFSNYSHTMVDIFAPGMDIYTTATNNQYESASGTSLAAPVTTGVAALLKSYFPKLTPAQLIRIIKESGTPIDADVRLPGDAQKQVPFRQLSSSGRIVNAYGAVKYAIANSQ